jgi:hypothetical protein
MAYQKRSQAAGAMQKALQAVGLTSGEAGFLADKYPGARLTDAQAIKEAYEAEVPWKPLEEGPGYETFEGAGTESLSPFDNVETVGKVCLYGQTPPNQLDQMIKDGLLKLSLLERTFCQAAFSDADIYKKFTDAWLKMAHAAANTADDKAAWVRIDKGFKERVLAMLDGIRDDHAKETQARFKAAEPESPGGVQPERVDKRKGSRVAKRTPASIERPAVRTAVATAEVTPTGDPS